MILCYTEDTRRNEYKNNKNLSLPNKNIVETKTGVSEKAGFEQEQPLRDPNEASFKSFVKRAVATKDNHPAVELQRVDA